MAMIRRAARRYAEAVYGLASAAQSQDTWAGELERLAGLLNVPVAEKALTSPAVRPAQKLAVIDLTARLGWFAAAVRDIRMLRIEEMNDLVPVVQRVAGLGGPGD